MKLEIGAGARAHDGFVALDLNPRNADVVGDALHLPFAAGSIEELRAVDVLEHLSYRDTHRALSEWARVCALGSELYVQTPDAGLIMQWYAAGDERLRSWVSDGSRHACTAIHGAQWRLLGGHLDGKYVDEGDDFRWNAHYALFDRQSLCDALNRAGFVVTGGRTNEHPNLCCWAVRMDRRP